jgi:hypothetical protein
MAKTSMTHRLGLAGLALIATVFGGMTLKSAYLVLFTTGALHQNAGNYVPLVVMFNGIAAFFYIAAGGGLFKAKQWAVKLAALIPASTLVVYGLFGLHVNNGGLYEMQTVVALAVRPTTSRVPFSKAFWPQNAQKN